MIASRSAQALILSFGDCIAEGVNTIAPIANFNKLDSTQGTSHYESKRRSVS